MHKLEISLHGTHYNTARADGCTANCKNVQPIQASNTSNKATTLKRSTTDEDG